MEHFHYFLYGRTFTLETDQKPLASIYLKHLIEISPRLQCLIFHSLPYQPFTVIYKRGKDIPLADALSRVSPTSLEKEEKDGYSIQLPIVAVNELLHHIPLGFSSMEKIRIETTKDPTLTLLARYITEGWPTNRKQVPQELQG